MRRRIPTAPAALALAALAAGCAPDPRLADAPLLMPRPAPYEPARPLGGYGPVLPPEATVPYRIENYGLALPPEAAVAAPGR